MGQRSKCNKNKFIKAVEGTGGIISYIAKRMDVTRKTLYEWLGKPKNGWATAYLQDERERIIDVAEKSLFQKAQEKDMRAVKYLLSTIGKDRGYVDKKEIKIEGGIRTDLSEAEKADLLKELNKTN